jgi:NAD-dependent deacetylase
VSAPPSPGSDFEQFVRQFVEVAKTGRVVVLTGAGISAESGIPTFRGREGYWTVGSREYQPQEIATRTFFEDNPAAVWGWYLYRRGLCHQAQPNAGHAALTQLAARLTVPPTTRPTTGPTASEGARTDRPNATRMTLVTQNVDGLHRRAGSPAGSLWEIHGNLDFMRCFDSCSRDLLPLQGALPAEWLAWERHQVLEETASAPLRCGRCGGWLRPHVLWFDEYYEEEFFGSDSSLASVEQADLLLVVGTSGATSLPMHMAQLAMARGIPLLDIDPEDNAFAAMAGPRGHLRATAAQALPALVQALAKV